MGIELDYSKNSDLFDGVASRYASDIGAGEDGVQNTQIRKFYDYVLKYEEQSRVGKLSKEEFESEILPFIKMLNSKVAYASTRKSRGKPLVNKAFIEMIRDCINSVSSAEDGRMALSNFKLFFEAVIGFHKALEDNKGDRS